MFWKKPYDSLFMNSVRTFQLFNLKDYDSGRQIDLAKNKKDVLMQPRLFCSVMLLMYFYPNIIALRGFKTYFI